MKVFVLPDLCLGKVGMQAALDAAFGPAIMRKVHGPSLVMGDFDAKGKRPFTFKLDVTSVPPPIRRFFCSSELDISVRQTLNKLSPTDWQLSNKLRMHCVAAELFKIRPVFSLREDRLGRVTLSARVRHDAVLPPPLNGIAEQFMMTNSQKELRHFAAELERAGVLEPPAPSPPGQRPDPQCWKFL